MLSISGIAKFFDNLKKIKAQPDPEKGVSIRKSRIKKKVKQLIKKNGQYRRR